MKPDSQTRRPLQPAARRIQRGVSMLFALCALAVLTLGAVALVRSVDTGMLVLGNLGFKNDAVAAGSAGSEAAIGWLQANAYNLDTTVPQQGYYATANEDVDATGATLVSGTGSITLVDWDHNGCTGPGTGSRAVVCLATPGDRVVNGSNTVTYVITRLCASAGPAAAPNSCVRPVSVSTPEASDKGDFGEGRIAPQTTGTAYRILTRTLGTRGTVAYTETLVHF